MEHVEVLERLRDRWVMPGERPALDAAIASLSAQPPAEAHCATCSCVPGMTPAVRFDTTPAEKEGAVRDHLIRMGWTPPAEAQAAPPSAPVGVAADILRIVDTAIDVCNDRDRPAMAEDLEAVRLYVEQASAPLAQQPAAGTHVGFVEWFNSCGVQGRPPSQLARAAWDAALSSQQPAAVDGAMVEVRRIARHMKKRALDGATRSALLYSDDMRDYADRLMALAAQQGGSDNV